VVRDTSKLARDTIEKNGLLSKLKLQTYLALFEHGPCTAGELFFLAGWHHTKNNHNISSRLGELRDIGVVKEVGERPCNRTGHTVIVWDVTSRLPLKSEKPKKIPCKHCGGKGYTIEQQFKLF